MAFLIENKLEMCITMSLPNKASYRVPLDHDGRQCTLNDTHVLVECQRRAKDVQRSPRDAALHVDEL